MYKVLLFIFLSLLPLGFSSQKSTIFTDLPLPDHYRLYREMNLHGQLSFKAFEQAIKGYEKLNAENKDLLTVIDFSKPSDEERLFIIDMKRKRLFYKSLVAHGKKSGGRYATTFSNDYGSFKSSLGFYLTENTYNGKNGYSLVLNGLEKGINDRAKERAVVIHGADYSNPSVARSSGRLGRSLGCPAVPVAANKKIINTIKNGTILFIYAEDENYIDKSSILSDLRTHYNTAPIFTTGT